MKLSIRLLFGNPRLSCDTPAGLVPSFKGMSPGKVPLPENEPMPIRFALRGFTAMPRLASEAIASGMLFSGSPPRGTAAGMETRFELLTNPRTPSYEPK